MATLILGAVGSALGGAVGGALGSMVGQAIDQQILGGGPRRGPRLGDLSIQTSAYGTMIPQIFGRMRVAGSVIWATDLKESEQAVSGGKGAPDELRYNYTASFAVALSSRRSSAIGRVWADGKLIRGAAGDLKVPGTLRFLEGSEHQAPDPMIASIEGVGATPGFRGLTLAIFENLSLADFGNRIPMLSFELIADDDAVTVGAILSEASDGLIGSEAGELLAGFAAHGSDLRAAVEPLVDTCGVTLRDDGVRLVDAAPATHAPGADDLGCSADAGTEPRRQRSRKPKDSVRSGVALQYYDTARDYQAGLAIAGEPGGPGIKSIDFAAVLDADSARRIAEQFLAADRAGREEAVLHLAPGFLTVQPGDLLTGAGLPNVWQLQTVEAAGLVATVKLRPLTSGRANLPGEAGRVSGSVDREIAPTVVALLDIAEDDGASMLVAGSTSGPWRAVPLTVAVNGVAQPNLAITRPAVMGRLVSALSEGPADVIDEANSVDVELVSDADWLASCDLDALAAGINLASVGDELIQFGRAEPIGARRFRLSKLLRGRRGREWTITPHAVGERFVLVDPARLSSIPLQPEWVGATVACQPHGLADGVSDGVERVFGGEGLRPLSPCHARAAPDAGGLILSWVRRSRSGFRWADGIDAPLDTATEQYRVRISCGTAQRDWLVSEPTMAIGADELAALGSGAAEIAIAQLGDRGVSHDCTLNVAI